ncbi:MAG: agmatine deiminase family protein [Candidatus Symbiothrix sp.]|nr:agmatine deiminase family protein [Candidatus Symbiothrix sp.]
MTDKLNIRFPAEWEPQSAVMLTWPHENTDWAPILDEVIPCFVHIAKEILKREKLIIVCQSMETVKSQLDKGIAGQARNDETDVDYKKITFRELPSNDTWARDHGPITTFSKRKAHLLDFGFNGWGLKFPSNHDNQITQKLYKNGAFDAVGAKHLLPLGGQSLDYHNLRTYILEGGSIESDGTGTILTTSECLLAPNRNEFENKEEIEKFFAEVFGTARVLWLDHGGLAGDDTDSHVDTLARFCNADTIAYVAGLSKMEKQLKTFKTADGKPYNLVPLPMAEAVYDKEGNRLPATYANFLIINDAVLMPTYGTSLDEIAKSTLQTAFPDREIVGINCLPLIRQHGSLHCVTMQLPKI